MKLKRGTTFIAALVAVAVVASACGDDRSEGNAGGPAEGARSQGSYRSRLRPGERPERVRRHEGHSELEEPQEAERPRARRRDHGPGRATGVPDASLLRARSEERLR